MQKSCARCESLARTYDHLVREHADGVRRVELERLLTDAVDEEMSAGEIDAYVNTCTQYRNEFPNDARSRQFGQAAENAAFWKTVLLGNSLVKGWTGKYHVEKVDEATARLAQIDEFGNGMPTAHIFDSYKEYLNAVSKALDTGEAGPLQRIFGLLGDSKIVDVWTLRTKDDLRYYSRIEPFPRSGSFVYKPINKPANDEPIGMPVRLGDVRPSYPMEAAQSRLAKRARRELEQMRASPALVEQHDGSCPAHDLDRRRTGPAAQSVLLQELMDQAGQGSYVLKLALTEPSKALAEAQIDPNIPWFDPQDASAKIARIKATTVIEKLGKLESLEQDVRAASTTSSRNRAAAVSPGRLACSSRRWFMEPPWNKAAQAPHRAVDRRS